MFVGMNEFNPHIGIVFETDIIGDLEENFDEKLQNSPFAPRPDGGE